MPRAKSNIVYNRSRQAILIITKVRLDYMGGPAYVETMYSVGKGQGIDLNILKMYPMKLKRSKK
jgi:hypothetical protein